MTAVGQISSKQHYDKNRHMYEEDRTLLIDDILHLCICQIVKRIYLYDVKCQKSGIVPANQWMRTKSCFVVAVAPEFYGCQGVHFMVNNGEPLCAQNHELIVEAYCTNTNAARSRQTNMSRTAGNSHFINPSWDEGGLLYHCRNFMSKCRPQLINLRPYQFLLCQRSLRRAWTAIYSSPMSLGLAIIML